MRPFDHPSEGLARHRRALLAVVTLVVAVISLACGSGDSNDTLTDTPSVAPSESPIPQPALTRSIEAGPVTITLVDVVTTSARSDFMLEFAVDVSTRTDGGHTVLVSDESVSVTGVEPIRPALLRSGDTIGLDRYTVTAGPPTFDAPLVVTLEELLLLGDRSNEQIHGPWSFAVPVEHLEQDPVNAVFAMDETVEADGVEVTVDEVRFSSNEILVLYTLSSGLYLSEPFRSQVLMELPDGAVIYSIDVEGGYTGPPPDWVGDHVTSFPPLPDGVVTFKLRFGPYLTPIPGGVTTITLPGAASLTTAGHYEVHSVTDSAGGNQTLVAYELWIRGDRFALRLRTNPLSDAVVTALPGADVTVEDDLGNAYGVIDRSIGFGQTDDRSVFFREEIIWLDGTVAADASQLMVSEPEFAELLTGPWEVHVDSPLAPD